MVRVIIALIMILSSFFGFSQTSEKEELVSVSVIVKDIRSPHGTFHISLYDSEDNFITRTAVDRKSLKISENSIVVKFENVPNGNYAIGCFHDENDNQKMDFYDSGMPKEKYGMSNNKLYYGPPTFDDAKFEVSGSNLTFDIKLF